jgi:N-acyl-D-amino-acid deacylase
LLDLVIANGRVADGTGRPAIRADVGVLDGRIARVADLSQASSARRIDASGFVVAPGFVDIHTHSDYTLLANPLADSSVRQGVTTEVLGNCGFSPAPLRDPELLSRLVVAHISSVQVDWRSFGEYLDRLERDRLSINVAALVGHGAVRAAVLGFEDRGPTPAEMQQMESLVAESLSAGAVGISSGLEYTPGRSSTSDELVMLCRIAGEQGGLYSTHVRNRDARFLDGFTEALETARSAGVRLQISHITPKYGAPPGAAERTLRLLEEWRELGVDVAGDVMLYSWCPTVLTAILPPWAMEGDVETVLARLADPAARDEMRRHDEPIWRLVTDRRWDKIKLFRSTARPDLVGMTFAEIGERLRLEPFDAACDLMIAEGPDLQGVWMLGHILEEEHLWQMLEDPHCAVCSDGMSISPTGSTADLGWGPRCYGWAPMALRLLTRERRLMSLEEAVRRMTSLPASRVGLSDRGQVAPGFAADIVVFDPEGVSERNSYDDPARYPAGIQYVLVNGEIVVERGGHTGARPGQVLRKR